MKKKLLAVLLILTSLCLTGCSVMQENILKLVADQTAKAGTDVLAAQFVDGLLANDAEAALSAMCSEVTMAQMLSAFPQMRAMLPDTDEYTLVPTYFSTNTNSGITTIDVEFTLTMGDQVFCLTTRQMTGYERLTNIHIQPAEADAMPSTADAKPIDLDAADIAVMLLSLACAVFITWALVDCIRHKMKRKWLWILLILLADVSLTLLLSGGNLGLQLHFGLFVPMYSFARTAQGGFTLQVGWPIGALVYMLRRRKLIVPAVTFQEVMTPEAPSDSENE